jgi:hypothetical protein
MDPKTQDCIGLYLYGAGYFARDQNTLGLVTGQKSPPHFCLSCPKRAECEDRHEMLTRERMPALCEVFDRRMSEAQRRGVPPTLAAMYLAKKGLDPFAKTATDNFNRGHGDRGRTAGPLVQ